jgi:hypothetical protein
VSGERVYTRERWEFEGYIGKRKIAGYVEFENGVLYECGVTAKDYEPQFQRYDIDCNGVAFDSENNVFNMCFEVVLSVLEGFLKEGEDVEVRIGIKEVRKPMTQKLKAISSEENDNGSLIDLMILH